VRYVLLIKSHATIHLQGGLRATCEAGVGPEGHPKVDRGWPKGSRATHKAKRGPSGHSPLQWAVTSLFFFFFFYI
jgi:hypothetical protein